MLPPVWVAFAALWSGVPPVGSRTCPGGSSVTPVAAASGSSWPLHPLSWHPRVPSLLCSLASCHFLLVLLSGPPAPPCTRSRCPGLLSALGLFSFPSVLKRDAIEVSPAEPSHAPQSHGLLPALHSSSGLPGPRSCRVQDESPQPPSGDHGVTPITPSVVRPLSTLTPVTMTPSSQTCLMAGCHPVRVSGGVCLPPGFTLTACPPHGGQDRPSKLCSLRSHPPDPGPL